MRNIDVTAYRRCVSLVKLGGSVVRIYRRELRHIYAHGIERRAEPFRDNKRIARRGEPSGTHGAQVHIVVVGGTEYIAVSRTELFYVLIYVALRHGHHRTQTCERAVVVSYHERVCDVVCALRQCGMCCEHQAESPKWVFHNILSYSNSSGTDPPDGHKYTKFITTAQHSILCFRPKLPQI